MTFRIALGRVKSQPLGDLPHGFFWHLTVSGGDSGFSLMLKADSADDHRKWIWLTGNLAFKAQYGTNQSITNYIALPVGGDDWVIELPDQPKLSDSRETAGALIVCNEGAYLAVKTMRGGFPAFAYVSLQNCSMHDSLPSQVYGVFTTWRLRTNEPNPCDRAILISQGEWPGDAVGETSA